ncbi:UrcA family protein [Sphingomonas sp. RS6]
MKLLVAAAAALSISTAAFAATSDTGFGKPSAVLSLEGLDLATADGQQRLAIRVDQAARTVCGDSLATIHPDLEARARTCRADVAEQVRSQIEARVAQAGKTRNVQLASAR